MSLRLRIVLSFSVLASAIFLYFVKSIVEGVKPRYREMVEESLVDTAELLAAVVSSESNGAVPNIELLKAATAKTAERHFDAKIYSFLKSQTDLRVYVTDSKGAVLFDTRPGTTGQDFSKWNDVRRTLSGSYGARTTRDQEEDPGSSVLYVAAPIVNENGLIGVLSVGKPARNINLSVERSRRELIGGAVITGVAIFMTMLLISIWVTAPLQRLTRYARMVRDGKRPDRPRLDSGEIAELADAYEEMREALEGKRYVERYIESLTHELKGPLTAIRGAAEILADSASDEKERRFTGHILTEAARIQNAIDDLLQLASLERATEPRQRKTFDLAETVKSVAASNEALIERQGITLKLDLPETLELVGDKNLAAHAVSNLLSNAAEFSPAQGTVEVALRAENNNAILTVRDHGPGIPDYALPRIFDRFYSLQRPTSGKKGTGLGLSIVREIAQIHQGSVKVENAVGGGAVAELVLPLG